MIVLMLQGRVGSTNQQAKTKTWLYSIIRTLLLAGTLNMYSNIFGKLKKKIFIPTTETYSTKEEEGDELLLLKRENSQWPLVIQPENVQTPIRTNINSSRFVCFSFFLSQKQMCLVPHFAYKVLVINKLSAHRPSDTQHQAFDRQ